MPAAPPPAAPSRSLGPVVVMGVSGSGKSTVGEALATRLGVPYADADAFHSPANVTKMSSGHALDDVDRVPWLEAIAAWLHANRSGAVVSCSALRRRYRDILRSRAGEVAFLHLDGDPGVIGDRVTHRAGHFMPPALLGSQLDTLERLQPDERGVSVDLALPVDQQVDAAVERLAALR